MVVEGRAVWSTDATGPRPPRTRVVFELRVEVGRTEVAIRLTAVDEFGTVGEGEDC